MIRDVIIGEMKGAGGGDRAVVPGTFRSVAAVQAVAAGELNDGSAESGAFSDCSG
jgi:hypothetical protein